MNTGDSSSLCLSGKQNPAGWGDPFSLFHSEGFVKETNPPTAANPWSQGRTTEVHAPLVPTFSVAGCSLPPDMLPPTPLREP